MTTCDHKSVQTPFCPICGEKLCEPVDVLARKVELLEAKLGKLEGKVSSITGSVNSIVLAVNAAQKPPALELQAGEIDVLSKELNHQKAAIRGLYNRMNAADAKAAKKKTKK